MGVAMYLALNKVWRPYSYYRFFILVFVFICYLLFGAYFFSLLNYKQEKYEIEELIKYQNEFYSNHSCIDIKQLNDLVSYILHANNKGIYPSSFANFNQSLNNPYDYKWKFGGETIFFTYTLLATIGYGHLAPYTKGGKVFCIFYIIIGVPLTLLLLSSITERISDMIYTVGDDKKNKLKEETQRRVISYSSTDQINASITGVESTAQSHKIYYLKLAIVFLFLIVFIYTIPAYVLIKYTESKWSYLEAIYYCFISLTTIGLGDYVPGNYIEEDDREMYRLLMTFYLLIGILTTMTFVNLLTKIPLLNNVSQSFSIRPATNNNNNNDSNKHNTSTHDFND